MEGNNMQQRPIENFLKQPCISKMNDEHKRAWQWFATQIKDDLDSRPLISGTAFTPHDFSRHCYNIYRIVSKILDKQLMQNFEELSSESLLLLNISILFHDYSMSQDGTNRLEHSDVSAKLFKERYAEWAKNSGDTTSLTVSQRKKIQTIIRAHSDIKTSDDVIQENTIEAIKEDVQSADIAGEYIHVKFLAGMLRMADELDVTIDRAGNELHKALQLDSTDSEQNKSIKHWKKLKYFYEIKLENADVILRIDNDVYSEDTAEADYIIREVINHANRELEMLTEKCFEKYSHLFNISRIRGYNSESTMESYFDFFKKPQSENPLEQKTDNVEVAVEASSLNIIKFSPALSDDLDKIILQEKLLESGHFNLNNSVCSRDWIKTREMIEIRTFRKRICDEIRDNFISLNYSAKNTLLVGIETLGSILASSIAHDLCFPFSYIIPDKSKDEHSMQDKHFNAGEFENIILFTDVIVTFETEGCAIEDNDIFNKIKLVYSIFFRPVTHPTTGDVDTLLSKMADKFKSIPIRIINDKFPTTLFAKQQCNIVALADRCKEDYRCLDWNKIGGLSS
jgi:adenine/guanine phosphoribosyltransferase-like PRPP-binding protein